MNKKLVVDGFQFNTEKEYNEAKKEAEAIGYINLKMDLKNPHVAMKVYYRFLDQKNLHTVIGITFLQKLRDSILSSGIIEDENLRYVYNAKTNEEASYISGGTCEGIKAGENGNDLTERMDNSNTDGLKDRLAREKEERLLTLADYYKQKLKTARITIFVLLAVIASMFIIALTGKNSPFEDAEIKIQNKYAEWAEQLEQKEAELNEREAGQNTKS